MGTPYILDPLPMPPPARRVPVEDYLAEEAVAETRTEYLDGCCRRCREARRATSSLSLG